MTNANICQNFPPNQPAAAPVFGNNLPNSDFGNNLRNAVFANNLPNPVFANQPIPDFPNQQMPHFRVQPISNQQQFHLQPISNQQQFHQYQTGLLNQQNPNLQKFDPNRPIGY